MLPLLIMESLFEVLRDVKGDDDGIAGFLLHLVDGQWIKFTHDGDHLGMATSMCLEIIERLQTILALIQGFAGG